MQRGCASEIDAFRAPERSMIAVMITTASLHEPDDSYSEHGVLEAVLRTENTSLKRIFSQSTSTRARRRRCDCHETRRTLCLGKRVFRR